LPARELATAYAHAPKDFVGVMNTGIDLRTATNAVVDRNVMRLEWIGKQPELRTKDTSANDAGAAAADTSAKEAAAKDVKEQPSDGTVAMRSVPVIQPVDPEELAMLLRRGLEFLQTGDIAAARLMLRRAANAGNAQAALALGATYDPYVFGELGVLGFAPDVAQARIWYERAGQLGAAEASRRIERLARLGR
jgi:TPR repeat protein